ncbi:MAG: TRAP transporter substrate-binding protein DctP [Deltaproteobacteria bacterium]|nr:TRAP transporter substrate-binding protein DctP [Deltaproteobacteria bacterium]
MKGKKLVQFIGIGFLSLVMIFSIVISAQEAQAKPVTLVLTTHEAPGGTYATGFYAAWMAEIEKRTNGQVKIEPHFGGELVNMMDAYDACRKGAVDVAGFLTQMVTGKFPMDEIVTFTTYDNINYRIGRSFYELYKKFPEFQAEYKDVKLLFLGATYFTSLTSTKKTGPITSMDQINGKKYVGIGKWASARAEALGWSLASLPPQDVFTAFQTGVVDAGPMGTLFILWDWGWGELFPYCTRVRTNSTPIAIVLNLDKWNKLSKDVQNAMDETIEWSIDYHDEWQIKVDIDLKPKIAEKFGTEFLELTKEETARWNAADQPVRDKYVAELEANGMPGKELMAEWLRLEEKYSTPPDFAK